MTQKFQQGGQLDQIYAMINSQPEQALQQLVQSGASAEDIAKIVETGVQQGKIKPEIGQAIMQALQGQTRAARHGAKLNYIKSLKNQCPEGEELYYYKKGGSVGCGCKKKEDGGEIEKAQKGSVIQNFKNRAKKAQEKANSKEGWDSHGNYIVTKKGMETRKKELENNKTKDETTPPNINKGIGKNCMGSKIKKHQEGSIIELFKNRKRQ